VFWKPGRVCGPGPATAQALVELGVELHDVVTLPSLQEGVLYALGARG